ncbi:MAG TPA: hypothetical protein PLB35_00890 [Myxococcota bacterium]|nr:hypothetical protein [Myxococcota bacterium]HOA12485.1 hypothetical protein [Myxococcota bacterium]HOH75790.1 hypothetical protein [Myxococcota bacterium]HPV03264.1 hypothetical protein [Myxococcota bacterium]
MRLSSSVTPPGYVIDSQPGGLASNWAFGWHPGRGGQPRKGFGVERIEGGNVSERQFHAFEGEDLGPEAIIGGEGRLVLDKIPEYFQRFERLILPSRPDTVQNFRKHLDGRPVVVEVGSGRGRLLCEVALSRPDAVCLGLETGLGLCGDALKRAEKKGASNLFMAWGDARRTIPMLVDPGSADAAYLLFPDPWWKKKHASRRHGALTGITIANALRSGGILHLKSDVEPYLHEIVAAFLSTGMYDRLTDDEAVIAAMPLTDREVRLTAAGTPVFAAVLLRRA